MGIREKIKGVVVFMIARYPFVNAITMLLLLAERAKREDQPPFDPKMIYTNLAIFVLVGASMGFAYGRKNMALFHAGQLIYLAGNFYMNDNLKYSQWLKVKIGVHMLGVAGVFILYAYFATSLQRRSPQLKRLGETILGIYLVAVTYMFMESREDKTAFLKFMPGGEWTLFVFTLIYGACALCYVPGMFVHDVTQILILLMIGTTCLIQCQFDYWTKKRGLDYWVQVRILADNICVILGLGMYLTCTRKQIYSKED